MEITDIKDIHLWQTLRFRDADTMIGFLEALGFRQHALYRDEQDPRVVHHAEYVRDGGGVMFGTVRDDPSAAQPAGHAAAYLVTPEPDALFERALAAGGTVSQPMVDQDYGGRGGTVRDPEGNLWSIGSYQPA